ncbi:MAG: SHOCT domain-containing protein [Bifidobacterium sp.]|uniref:SHOCT domain-containing protein n=1 Tax=Bifidobacterium fermentum TaxID=3059035 RepID=A0AB39UD70_9BIFI
MKRSVREDVVDALKPHKVNWSNKQTLLNLSESLSSNETVTALEYVRCHKDGGYLSLSNQRILFTGMAISISLSAMRISIPISTITSVDIRGRLLRSLYISTAGQSYEFTSLSESFAQCIVNAVSEHVPQTSSGPIDSADRLLKLKQLLDAGVLTQGEYEAKASVLKSAL